MFVDSFAIIMPRIPREFAGGQAGMYSLIKPLIYHIQNRELAVVLQRGFIICKSRFLWCFERAQRYPRFVDLNLGAVG